MPRRWGFLDLVESLLALALLIVPGWAGDDYRQPVDMLVPVMHFVQVALQIDRAKSRQWWLGLTSVSDLVTVSLLVAGHFTALTTHPSVETAESAIRSAGTPPLAQLLGLVLLFAFDCLRLHALHEEACAEEEAREMAEEEERARRLKQAQHHPPAAPAAHEAAAPAEPARAPRASRGLSGGIFYGTRKD